MSRPVNLQSVFALFFSSGIGLLFLAFAPKMVGELPGQAQTSQPSQEELRRLFLGEKTSPSPTPSRRSMTPTPRPRVTPRPSPTPQHPRLTASPAATSARRSLAIPPSHSDERPRRSTPKSPATASAPENTAARRSGVFQRLRERRIAEAEARNRSAQRGGQAASQAQVLVTKDGLLDEEEQIPPPSPTPRQRRWTLFGGREKDTKRYRYLTPALRKELDLISVRRGRWQYVIVHNSATRNGNARIFDHYHRRVRKMRNGMAYHFVIGNGSASPMGRIEIGDRWRQQINGGHVASDRLNNIAIGICLVGDYDKDVPPQQQLDALKELTDYLRERAGNPRRKTPEVKGHREINPKPTSCPGRRFPLNWLHRTFG